MNTQDLDPTYNSLHHLIGLNITGILMSETRLQFETNQGTLTYHVTADCCSRSYFHDFIGADKLITNGPIISTKTLPITHIQPNTYSDPEDTKIYGHEIVTNHPTWGHQTTILSYRNESNGWYGGTLEGPYPNQEKLPEKHRIHTNTLETEPETPTQNFTHTRYQNPTNYINDYINQKPLDPNTSPRQAALKAVTNHLNATKTDTQTMILVWQCVAEALDTYEQTTRENQ